MAFYCSSSVELQDYAISQLDASNTAEPWILYIIFSIYLNDKYIFASLAKLNLCFFVMKQTW